MKSLRIYIVSIFLLFCSLACAQDFTFEYQNLDDSTLWFVKNNTANPVKPTSVTLNWYHMKPYFVAWNNDPDQPFYNSTNREMNVGFKYSWKYKTTYGCSIGDTIPAGGRIQVAMTVNYDENNSDTVMPANVTLFVNKVTGFEELEVIPQGSTCGFKRIYLNSYFKNQGISYFSTVWTPITTGNCVDGLGMLMVPFNGFNLKPTPSAVMPQCANGRLWTSYGYPRDSQLYYDGTESDITYWKQVIQGLDPGDYLAFASHVTVSKSFIENLKSEFESIGVDVDKLVNGWSSSSAQLLLLGRKGVGKGKAGLVFSPIISNASPKSVVGNFVMIKDQATDEMKPYPQCYEAISVVHKPYIPDTSWVSVREQSVRIRISPNPVEDDCFVRLNKPVSGYLLVNAMGQTVKGEVFNVMATDFSIPMAELSVGLYYLVFTEVNGKVVYRQIVQKQ